MAYKKFDDPTLAVSQSVRKIYEAIPKEAYRRALQGAFNRILCGTHGTATLADWRASCGTGGAGTGLGVSGQLFVIVNGVLGTRGTAASYNLPAGTQGAATIVKYLISGPINSTAGTVTAGNESATTAGALLPDLPDGHVALGYMLYNGNGTVGWNRGANVATGQDGATSGTASFVDLMHMPYDG